MDIKKRDFLFGAGLAAAAATDALAQGRGGQNPDGGYPPGVPKATGRTMLDSPHYIGTASKGYGFKANWNRTLPMVPFPSINYKPRPHQQGDRAVGRQPGRRLCRIRSLGCA